MKIKETDVNAKIRQAYVNAVPDICDVILSDCKQEKGQVVIMEETKKKKSFVKYMMAAAACLVLITGGGFGFNTYRLNHTVASTISLEVNPSIEIAVNEKERVLNVKALNKDGEIVIGDMDFSGSDIDVVINALIGSMLRNGYLNELANSILISVDNADPEKGTILQERLTEKVNELLEADGFFGAVLGQTLTDDSELQKQADLYGITLGKAQLIEQILESTQGHTFEELALLSINELNLLLGTAGTDMDKVSAMGNASDKAYIGEGKAKEIAFAYAGVPENAVTFYQMEMDVEKGVMVYEIEFHYNGFEYEYDIDAQTGEIVKNKKEVDDDAPVGADEKFVPESDVTVNETVDHYYGISGDDTTGADSGTVPESINLPGQTNTNYNYGTEHHYDPHDNESHHNNTHHGTYYSGDSGNSGSTGNTGNSGNTADTSVTITADQAKAIALDHAGQTADAAWFEKVELDYDDGVWEYEIEFKVGNLEYEYDIDAQTGAIRDYEWDHD